MRNTIHILNQQSAVPFSTSSVLVTAKQKFGIQCLKIRNYTVISEKEMQIQVRRPTNFVDKP